MSEKLNSLFKDLETNKKLYNNQAHPSISGNLNNIGQVYLGEGKLLEALPYFTQALAMNKVIYNDKPWSGTHVAISGNLLDISKVYLGEGKLLEALPYFTQALEMHKIIYHDQAWSGTNVAISHNDIGRVYLGEGKHLEALPYFTQALAMNKVIYKDKPWSGTHVAISGNLHDIGKVYLGEGKHLKALPYFTQSLEMNKVIYQNKPHPSISEDMHFIDKINNYYNELENSNKDFKTTINELENNNNSWHIAKTGKKDTIVIEKEAHIDPEVKKATDLEHCKNAILNFNPLEGDTVDLSHYGKFTVDQVSFATFTSAKTATNQIRISGVKISAEEDYVACVYGFDADKFFAPDYVDPDTGAPHMLNPHDVITLSQAQHFHGEL